MNKQKIKYQAQELIVRLESLEVYIKVAKSHAKAMVKVCEAPTLDVNKLAWAVSSHELPRLADLCRMSATRFDYAMDLMLEESDLNH